MNHATQHSSVTPSAVSRARRRLLAAGLGVAGAAALSCPALASYPDKTVRIIVPYAPGGGGDVFARLLAERLTIRLGQSFIVENRPGATGTIGSRYVANETPDGSVLLLGQTGEIAVMQYLSKQLSYDPDALLPVALAGDFPLVLVAHPSAPFNTVQEMVAESKKRPQGFSYASAGTGSPGHLAAAALALKTGAKLTHVPYKGGGAALSDLMGNHVDMFFSPISGVLAHVKSHTLKPIAAASLERAPALPDVPTVAESGLPGYSFSVWGGIFAPPRTPQAVVTELNKQINEILAEKESKEKLEAVGAIIKPNSQADFRKFIENERHKYAEIVARTGATVD
ncbi:Bug family tripartite tricarboxylate transporter substrate binding protein [Achromobacter aloeverae]|uniref:ABC transporter substrate-binding protein n=1 Tax=Achromobacter aloeverae TaxID=1750518 RepID=A0A4Q1HLQ8_9BURK|nr:tripartite tricarboxylate transporter substrate binding protein [Achromobacter aloeverae]RXN90428.1 ABC transporter substrate-binding protein [Achromobacter aloeverae]